MPDTKLPVKGKYENKYIEIQDRQECQDKEFEPQRHREGGEKTIEPQRSSREEAERCGEQR